MLIIKYSVILTLLLSLSACGESSETTIKQPGKISVTQTSVAVIGSRADNSTPETVTIPIEILDTEKNLYLYIEQSDSYHQGSTIEYQKTSPSILDLHFKFREASYLSVGKHFTIYRVSVCFDDFCEQQLEGSPVDINVNYEVKRLPIATQPINPTSRTEIHHDIIDAEYSKTLDAIAIASSSPRNAVYVYHLDDGTINELPLNVPPTSITFANAGLSSKIAVGHNAWVTWIDYNATNPSLSTSKVLNTSTDVFDMVATEDAAFVIPHYDQWSQLHKIDINNNSVTTSGHTSIYGKSKIKMHPELQSIYIADNGISPDDIHKINIADFNSSLIQNAHFNSSIVQDSPYHGEYEMCGNLWIGNEGKRVYTACGNLFNTTDLTYSGKIPIEIEDDYYPYRIQSFSESLLDDEIAIIQKQQNYGCDDTVELNEACINYISFFSKTYLNSLDSYAFDVVTVSGKRYAEKPLHVFYAKDGKSVHVLSRLQGIPTPKSYLLEFSREVQQ